MKVEQRDEQEQQELGGCSGTQYQPEQLHDMVGEGIALCDALGIACRRMAPLELYMTVGTIQREVRAISRFRQPDVSGLDTLSKIRLMTDEERWNVRDRVLGVVVLSPKNS